MAMEILRPSKRYLHSKVENHTLGSNGPLRVAERLGEMNASGLGRTHREYQIRTRNRQRSHFSSQCLFLNGY